MPLTKMPTIPLSQPVVGNVVLAAKPQIVVGPIPVARRANSSSGLPLRRRSRPSGVLQVRMPAGAVRRLDEAGDGFCILQTNLPVKIQPQPAGRAETYYAGATPKFSDPFDSLLVTNPSTTAALVLVIWVGFEDLRNFTWLQSPAIVQDAAPTVLAATGTIQPVSAADLYFRKLWLYGISNFNASGSPVANLGTIWLGKTATRLPDYVQPSVVNGLTVPGALLYEVPDGQLLNLANIYFSGTAGDGVYFVGT